jgi:Uma2 family endonuclease
MGMAVSVPRYTVDDLARFPDDGNRYELLDGMLLVTPQARAVHQRVAGRIQALLYNALEVPGHAAVVGPGAISVPPRTQLQPDVLVYPSRFGVDVDWETISEHWLAVEVLSRSSRVYDREFKRAAYLALRVPQVWLVDVAERSVEVWTAPATRAVVRDEIRWSVAETGLVVTIDLSRVFDGLR